MSLSIITVQLATAFPLALLHGKKIAIFPRESASRSQNLYELVCRKKKRFSIILEPSLQKSVYN